MAQGAVQFADSWISWSNSALDDWSAIIAVRFKLPAFAADSRMPGREFEVAQLSQALRLHDLLNERIACFAETQFAETSLANRGVLSRIDRIVVEEGSLRHQATIAVGSDTVYVGGLSFAATAKAPPDFKLYPCLRDLSLASRCPYPLAPRLT